MRPLERFRPRPGGIAAALLVPMLLAATAAEAVVPILQDDFANTNEDQAVVIFVLANGDFDPDGTALTVIGVTQPPNGTATTNGTTVTYSPNANFFSPPNEVFTYTVQDGNGERATANVTVTVVAVDEDVSAQPDGPFSTNEDTVLNIPASLLLANDTAPDGGLAIQSVQNPSNGSVALSGNGQTVTFTPAAEFSSPPNASFTYTARDADGDTDTAIVSINVISVDEPPDAVDDTGFSTNEDTPIDIPISQLLINDSAPDGGLAFVSAQNPSNGAVAVRGQTVTFTPNENFSSPPNASFTYTVRDGDGDTDTATVTITVIAVDEPPDAVDDTGFSTNEDNPLNIPVSQLLANDSAPDGGLAIVSVQNGVNGTVQLIGSTVRFVPAADFASPPDASFTYTVRDVDGDTDTATVAVTVIGVDEGVTAVDDGPLPATEDTPLNIPAAALLLNDLAPDGGLTILSVQSAVNGTVVLIGSTVIFTPALDFFSPPDASFTYTAQDADGDTDTAVVTITVTAVDEGVTAVDDGPFAAAEDTPLDLQADQLLANDSAPDGGLVIASVQGAINGTVVLNGSTVTFTPALDFVSPPAASFTYVAQDADGDTGIATVTINVGAVNDPPVITGVDPLATPEETPIEITLAQVQVTDPDNDPADLSLIVQPGANYTQVGNVVTPALDFNGNLEVNLVVSDGIDASAVFPAIVTVTPVNDRPLITGQSPSPIGGFEDTTVTILFENLLVSDPDNVYPTEFTITALDGDNYTVVGTSVTPDENFNGALSVPVTVNDSVEDSDVFVLAIEVGAVNDPPTVLPIPPQQAVEASPFIFNAPDFFSDVDVGDALTYDFSGLPDSGRLTFDPTTGVLSGTPQLEDARDEPYVIAVSATDLQLEVTQTTFDLIIAALDRANVSLSAGVAPSPALLDEQVLWRFDVTNAGPAPAIQAVLEVDMLGSGLNAGPTDPRCMLTQTVGALGLDCQLGDLPSGASAQLVVPLSKSVAGDILATGRAGVAGTVPVDPSPGDNSASATLNVSSEFSDGATQTVGTTPAMGVAVGDVDGDGTPDVVVATPAGNGTEIFVGDGFRSVAETPLRLGDSSPAEGIALADIDGDLDLEIVLAVGLGQPNVILLNDGTGQYPDSIELGLSDSRDVVVADFDADGTFELVFANASPNSVYASDGMGGFVLIAALGDADSRGVAAADLDLDGQPDLIFANADLPAQIYWSRGSGAALVFEPGPPLGTGGYEAVSLADFNSDGRPDVVLASIGDATGAEPSNPVYLNTIGGFVLASELGYSRTTDVLTGDVDGDDNQDIVVVNETGAHQVYAGDGTGQFALRPEQIASPDARVGALADLDRTGDLDLVLGLSGPGGISVFLNDSFGNLGLGDGFPPEITLLGESQITVIVGQDFEEPGFSAEDNIDGDLTDQVIVDNPVNTRLIGEFTITYTVSDSAGNVAQATRLVRVEQGPVTSSDNGGGAVGIYTLVILLLLGLLGRFDSPHTRLLWVRKNR